MRMVKICANLAELNFIILYYELLYVMLIFL